jgi:hypothetical protein
VCPATKLRFVAEIELVAAISIRCCILFTVANLRFVADVVLSAPNFQFAAKIELMAAN